VRETFRKNRFSQSVDVVFLAQKEIVKYSFSDLNEMLAEAFSNLQKKLQKYD
jgi:RNase P protein component